MKPDPRRTLSVLDATSMVHRAWYGAFRGGDGPGEPARACQEGGAAFAAVLGRVLTEVRPPFALAVFDGGGETFRHRLHDGYKAHRKPPPPGLAALVDHAPKVARALGLWTARTPGVEADDLLAVATERGRRAGLSVVLVSPDKDVVQLLGEGVYRADPQDFELESADDAEVRYGIPPSRFRDYLALTGDQSDGIPGAPKVGPKTAVGLLLHAGSLEALFEAPDAARDAPVRGASSAVDRILAHESQVRMSWELVGLRTDLAAPDLEGITLGDLRPRPPSPDAVALGVPLELLAKLTAVYART